MMVGRQLAAAVAAWVNPMYERIPCVYTFKQSDSLLQLEGQLGLPFTVVLMKFLLCH